MINYNTIIVINFIALVKHLWYLCREALIKETDTMARVALPYKLQVWLPDTLRDALKDLAQAERMTLQDLIVSVLDEAVKRPRLPERQRRDALTA